MGFPDSSAQRERARELMERRHFEALELERKAWLAWDTLQAALHAKRPELTSNLESI